MHLFVKEGYHDVIYIGTKLNGSKAKAYAGCFRYCNKYQIRHFDFIFEEFLDVFNLHRRTRKRSRTQSS